MTEKKQRDLFYGDNSIVDRLNKLKSQIFNNQEYSYLLNGNGEITNELINQLIPAY